MKITIKESFKKLEKMPARSAWDNGIKKYAFDLLGELEEALECYGKEPNSKEEFYNYLLNGADNWTRYSWGGCSLCYNGDIAARLCTPSELRKTRNGEHAPNGKEEWLDVQARALHQSAQLLAHIFF